VTDQIRAPWTPEQVAALNQFQREGGMHPFTCVDQGGPWHARNVPLEATASGWECPSLHCHYRQDWAHAFMADPNAWPKPFADLRPATGQPARTTPDNPATSSDTADNPLREQIAAAVEDEIYEYRERTMFWEEGGVTTEIARLATRGAMEAVEREMEQLRADANAWRHKAVRRALAISKLRGTIDACIDLADEPVTDRTGWGDGYRAAIGDLREILREFGHLQLAAAAEPGERT
jgi:hypothetical protein